MFKTVPDNDIDNTSSYNSFIVLTLLSIGIIVVQHYAYNFRLRLFNNENASTPMGTIKIGFINLKSSENLKFLVTIICIIFVDLYYNSQYLDLSCNVASICIFISLIQQANYKIKSKNSLLPISSNTGLFVKDKYGWTFESMQMTIKRVWNHISADPNTLKLLMFVTINFVFMFIELIYGFLTNSLGLISDAGHMLFDCVALVIGLYASYISSIKANSTFTYGYGRFEILSGYINGIFLVFVAFFVFVESVERLFEETEIESDSLLVVSILGFIVNMIGIIFFHDTSHGGHGHCGHGHSHGSDHHCEGENMNMTGIYLHILADTLGSVGVIVSSLLIKYFGWTKSDAICSIVISILILMSVFPFLYKNTLILLSKIPSKSYRKFTNAINQIKDRNDVLNVDKVRFWSFTDAQTVATMQIIAEADANSQTILQSVIALLKSSQGGSVSSLSVEIIKKSDNNKRDLSDSSVLNYSDSK